MTDVVSTEIDDLAAWRQAYLDARDKEAGWREVKDIAKAHMLDRLREKGATVGTVDGVPSVSYSMVRGRVDLKALAKDHPELVEKYRGPMTSRFQVEEVAG